MRYNKRKLNFMIFFTIFLICITVGLGTADFSGSIGSSDAEPGDEIVDDSEIVVPPDEDLSGDVGEGSQPGSGESGGGQTSNNYQNIPELTVKFNNAWTVWNYAIQMDEKYKSYVSFYQTIKGEAAGYPVSVDVILKRDIYKDISQVYVVNNAKTNINVLEGFIDVGNGKNYTSYTCFDAQNNLVTTPDHKTTMDEYYAGHHVFTYELPYIINQNTVSSAYLTSNYKKSYYEVSFVLNSKAWANYAYAVKGEIGAKDLPSFSSITVTAKISKQYGTFISISATENYSMNYEYGAINANVSCQSNLTMSFNYFSNFDSNVGKIKDIIGIK